MRLLGASRDLVGLEGLGFDCFESSCWLLMALEGGEGAPDRRWVQALPGLPCARLGIIAQRPNSPRWGSDSRSLLAR